MCVLMPHGSDVLRDSFGAVVDVLSLFWGWLLLTVALGLYLVFGVVYNAEVTVRVAQIFLFGKERGTHFSSEPTWSGPEFWAGVKEKVQIPCTQGSSAEPGSEDIDPSEGSRPPTPGVLSSLWFCDLGSAGSSEQGTQSLERPTGAQLVVLHFEALVMKFCLILCQKWVLCRWLSSFPVWSRITAGFSTVPLGSVPCAEYLLYLFTFPEGVTLMFMGLFVFIFEESQITLEVHHVSV